ncbi:MAG TPA: aldehyde dehydrogenase family protein [Sporichthya sp.]|nr:aldehyde dehydrogenase family protein [Sporichthya sp.]
MRTYDHLYIDGAWVSPTVPASPTQVYSAADGSVVATVPAGSPADVDVAVDAARRAFDSWSQTTPAERAALITALADALEARADELAEMTAVEVGMPKKLARRVQIGGPLISLRAFADILGTYEFSREVNNSLVVKEPAGVVGAITPWNYPLNQVVAKVGPALAAGCTIVLKPSDEAPSPVFVFAECCAAAGIPAGVFNLVSGGDDVGKALAAHTGVDVVSFTGSTAAGAHVAQAAGKNINRVALELGGKSANVILDDADLEKAVTAGVNNAMLNSGQTCAAWTRMLVPAQLHDEAVAIAEKAIAKLTLGHPLEDTTRLGPLASAEQQSRVRNYIEIGVAEGARLVAGGSDVPEDLPAGGYYVRPTVFADVKPTMRIAREEIFGPVLSIMPYTDEEEAVAIANDTDYGLHGAVWSQDGERAMKVARRLRTGQVDVNGGAWNPLAPFGGYKKSGLGREYGEAALDEYLEIKSIQR